MNVYAVVGARGAGTTSTSVNLAAGLRREGHHAAVLDLTCDVCKLFDVMHSRALLSVCLSGGSINDATETVEYSADGLEGELRDYYEVGTYDETAFRASRKPEAPDPSKPNPGELPIIRAGNRASYRQVDEEDIERVLGDLAFTYDYVIMDAGKLCPAVSRMADGVIPVTTPAEEEIVDAQQAVADSVDQGLTIVGSVINHVTDDTDVDHLSRQLNANLLAVLPYDARTPDIEPVVHLAPDSAGAAAYQRLVDEVETWDGTSGLVGGVPDPQVATDGRGPESLVEKFVHRLR